MSRDIKELRSRLEEAAGGCHHGGPVTVRTLVKRFMAHARSRYSPRLGESSNEVAYCELAFRPLLLLYGDRLPRRLGPLQWRAVQMLMIEQGLCCRSVNARMARLRRMLRWGVARGLVDTDSGQALEVLEPVRPPQAPQPAPVEAVPVEDVEATLPFMGPVTAIMSKLQLLTAMRPGEVVSINAPQVAMGKLPTCQMQKLWHGQAKPLRRPMELDVANRRIYSVQRDSPVWIYRPAMHKTAWRGTARNIPLGPKAQALIAPYMLRSPTGPLFRTRLGGPFTVNSYSQAVRRASIAAVAAGAISKRWSVNQLRHTAAILAAKESLRTAQDLLGHSDPKVTQTYLRGSSAAVEYAAVHG